MRLPNLILLALLPPALAACVPEPEVTRSAAEDYAVFCTDCHGAAGRGDGTLAEALPVAPADLTRLAARNGGVFPMGRVMSVIDGYIRTQHGGGGPMPEFGILAEGPMAAWDDGSGRPVPVPARLLALAEYLKSLQTD